MSHDLSIYFGRNKLCAGHLQHGAPGLDGPAQCTTCCDIDGIHLRVADCRPMDHFHELTCKPPGGRENFLAQPGDTLILRFHTLFLSNSRSTLCSSSYPVLLNIRQYAVSSCRDVTCNEKYKHVELNSVQISSKHITHCQPHTPNNQPPPGK